MFGVLQKCTILNFDDDSSVSFMEVTTLCTGVINTVLEVGVDTTNASVGCIFEPGYTCAIEYGTDSSYTNLIYRDNSTTLGQIAIITFSQELQEDTTYYFIVTATSSSQCLKMRGIFRTGVCINCGVYLTQR